MDITCEISLEFNTRKKAETIKHALSVDDDIFVDSTVIDTSIQATITSSSLSSLLHTLDDYLACVTVAEKIIKKENLCIQKKKQKRLPPS